MTKEDKEREELKTVLDNAHDAMIERFIEEVGNYTLSEISEKLETKDLN